MDEHVKFEMFMTVTWNHRKGHPRLRLQGVNYRCIGKQTRDGSSKSKRKSRKRGKEDVFVVGPPPPVGNGPAYSKSLLSFLLLGPSLPHTQNRLDSSVKS